MPVHWNFPLSPALALTGVYLGVLSWPVNAQGAADHVAMGIAAADVRDPRTALQHYQAALDQDSLNYEANWRGAMTLLTLGEQISPRTK
ncbi:MAG TPA: hypothetical protein VHH32_08095, partial [Gemmatimonadales bacterium]|nr:hypothetical protein [Gemmatimonadales bacterium]